jgi:small subunit ribosomal protein S9
MISSEKSNILALGIGRRKSSRASVKILPGKGEILINQKTVIDYFTGSSHSIAICRMPLEIFQCENSYNMIIDVSGGGIQGQTQAIKLAVAKALSILDSKKRVKLRSLGLLSRDTRVKERKKYGLKKARKASQYSKR